jgi:Enoyl-(Acyl carrier protein) reductase
VTLLLKQGHDVTCFNRRRSRDVPEGAGWIQGDRRDRVVFGGMDGVLRVLAKEISPNQLTVNQVAPGWTITEWVRRAGTPRQEAYEAAIPLKRRSKDQEVAHVIAFLAAD